MWVTVDKADLNFLGPKIGVEINPPTPTQPPQNRDRQDGTGVDFSLNPLV